MSWLSKLLDPSTCDEKQSTVKSSVSTKGEKGAEKSGRRACTTGCSVAAQKMQAGQEATVRTGHGTTDWFHIGKGVCQGCILSPCLFNLYAEYIMRTAGLKETQTGIKIAGRNLNNLRYADDTPLWQKVRKTKELFYESERGD